jgi:hypothetical protein
MSDKRVPAGEAASDRIADRIQFYLIFAATFVTLLAAATVSSLLPWMRRDRSLLHDKRWFVGRAWDDASTFVELAYMG